jgi:hypothetical protein
VVEDEAEGRKVMSGRLVRAAGVLVAGAVAATSGCYMFSPSQAAVNKANTQMHFSLAQCEQTAPNLYKCPGIDKSVCGAFYSGQQVDCLYLDKGGNAIVMQQ